MQWLVSALAVIRQRARMLSRRRLESLRTINHKRLHRHHLKKQPQRTRHGFLFNGHRVFLREDWERHEQDLIERLLLKADLFVNVGANVGYYCLLARSLGVKTIAFEPDSMNCELLIRNMRNNGFNDEFVLFPVAVGDVPGFADIHGRMDTVTLTKVNDDVSIPRRVPLVRLDDSVLGNDWATGRIVVLIDVEGWERHVLGGASRMLTLDPKPVWIIEVLPSQCDVGGSGGQCRDVFSLMRQAGYRSYHIAPDGKFPEFVDGSDRPGVSRPESGHNVLFVDSVLDISELI